MGILNWRNSSFVGDLGDNWRNCGWQLVNMWQPICAKHELIKEDATYCSDSNVRCCLSHKRSWVSLSWRFLGMPYAILAMMWRWTPKLVCLRKRSSINLQLFVKLFFDRILSKGCDNVFGRLYTSMRLGWGKGLDVSSWAQLSWMLCIE